MLQLLDMANTLTENAVTQHSCLAVSLKHASGEEYGGQHVYRHNKAFKSQHQSIKGSKFDSLEEFQSIKVDLINRVNN